MKVEVRCPGCGKGYLVAEATIPETGGNFTCQGCGAEVRLAGRRRSTESRPRREKTAPLPAADPSATGGGPPGSGASRDVVCPRCGLHFVPAGVKTTPKPGERPTILLVEDMEYFLEIAREALASRYEIKVARTVEEARRELAHGGVDLLLLDLTLQRENDGVELLRSLPAKPCPVLLYTAQDESEMYGDSWERLRDLGADDVVIKGMNVGDSLLRKVGALLGEEMTEDIRR